MLYILGGSPRSGKSTIGRKLVKEKAIPFFCIDFLITSLQEVKPLNIQHGQPFIGKAENLWPLVKPLLIHLLQEESNYLVEGDGILPKHVLELMKQYPTEIKSCFVGFSQADLNQKFKDIREFVGKGDWTKRIDDMKLKQNIEDMIEFSNYLKNECSKYNIPYFDSSNNNFNDYLESVFQYLTK